MKSSKIFLPESMYDIDAQMSREKLEDAAINGTSVTGKIIRLDSRNKNFKVYLGGQLTGIMSFEEATIYALYKDEYNKEISPAIYSLVGRTVRAKIVNVGKNILLSRKANMLEALPYVKDCSEFSNAAITAFSRLSAFIDVGNGITGRIHVSNFSPVFCDNIKDIGLNLNDIIPVKVIRFDSVLNQFDLSRIDRLPPFWETLNVNDQVVCKVFHSLYDHSGYKVLINNDIAGILDSPIELHYGDEVVALVRKINILRKGPQLDLVRKL